jgi:nucleotide-binding universal stress UspA family protein
MEIRHILFTSDLMEGSRYVFRHAMGLADKHGAKLTILHVMQEPSDSIRGLLGGILSEEQLEDLRSKHTEEAMTTLTGKSREHALIREGLEMFSRDAAAETTEFKTDADDVVVTAGHVAEEITRNATDLGCDLIVIGCHQRSLLKDAVLGGTLRGVLKRTKIPVFVVPIPKGLDD